jgi:hypothetical protein
LTSASIIRPRIDLATVGEDIEPVAIICSKKNENILRAPEFRQPRFRLNAACPQVNGPTSGLSAACPQGKQTLALRTILARSRQGDGGGKVSSTDFLRRTVGTNAPPAQRLYSGCIVISQKSRPVFQTQNGTSTLIRFDDLLSANLIESN